MVSAVTGANGFVGSHLVDDLLEKGDEVRCITRKSSNLRWLENKPVKIYDCGLFDIDGLKEALKDVDILYHVAGVVKAKNEEGYFNGNVETTKNLLEVLLEINPNIKRVVIVSSQTAAGPSTAGEVCTEETEPHPITTYGRSKLAQEKLALSYSEKLPITIIRPPAVFGERDTEIYLFFKTYQKGLMSLVGFDNKEVSLIYVKDVVRGIHLAANSQKAVSQIYFISSKEYYTWPQIGEVLKKVFGKKAVTLRLPHSLIYSIAAVAQFFSMFSSKAATLNIEKARDFVQTYWTCDISKAERELGYRQEYSLDEGLKRTIDWYLAEKWL